MVVNHDILFITHQKPHKRASRDTIGLWIQQIIITAGIYVPVYKPHSVRSAAALKVPINPKFIFRLNKSFYNSEQNGANNFVFGQNRNFL